MHTYAYWKRRHGRIILKRILDKYNVNSCIGLIWLQLQSHVNTVITWGLIGGESFLSSWTSINFLYSLTYCDNGGISPRIHDVGLRCTWVVIVRLRPDYPSGCVWYFFWGGDRVPEMVASRRRRGKSWPFWEIELWSFSRQPATSLTQFCGLVWSEFKPSWVFWYCHCVSLQTAACSRRLPAHYPEYSAVWGPLGHSG